MALTESQREIWSAKLELAAQEISIYSQVTNGIYEADATGSKIVHMLGITPGSVTPYVPGSTTLTYPEITDSVVDLNIDQKSIMTGSVDDFNKIQTAIGDQEMSTAILQDGRVLALTQDAYVLGLHASFGLQIDNGAGAALDVNSSNALDVLDDAVELLDNNNAPMERFAVITPWFKNKIMKAGLALKTDNDSLFDNGRVGSYNGLTLYVSNQTDGTGDARHCVVATNRAIAFASLLGPEGVETLRLIDTIGDAYRIPLLFGAAVRFPNEVVDVWVDKAAE